MMYSPIRNPYKLDRRGARGANGTQRTQGSQGITRTIGGIQHRTTRNDTRQTVQQRSRMQPRTIAAEEIHRVRITNGIKYGQRFILRALVSHVEALKPIMPRMVGQDFVFFVRDDDVALTLRSCSRRIRHDETGDRLNIIIRKEAAPWPRLKKDEIDVIESVVTSRESAQCRTLELNDFGTDNAFTSRDLMMNLTKNSVFLSVLELIETKHSNVVALSLKNNRLKKLEVASMLPYFAKNLKVLDLSDNLIDSLSELEHLRGLPLTTLFLDNNPVCEQYTRASDYLSAVQAIFPRLTILDGNACSPLTETIDKLEKECIEPAAKPSYCGSAALQNTLETFITEFFRAYDGDEQSRKALIAAYDDINSQFTMCLENLYEEGSGKTRWPNENFPFHIRRSHNIKQVEKWSKNRQSRLFHGAMDITAALCKMPETRHQMDSFLVDVVLATPTLLVFSIQGLFEEAPFAVAPNQPQMNFFSRTFTVVPKSNGTVSVISDELYLSALNPQRVERYRQQMIKCNSSVSAAVEATAPDSLGLLSIASTSSQELSDAAKNELIASFCTGTGMLPDWSRQCLEQAEWNCEVASRSFLASRDKIPQEAFASQ